MNTDKIQFAGAYTINHDDVAPGEGVTMREVRIGAPIEGESGVTMHEVCVNRTTGAKSFDGVSVENLTAEQRAVYESTVPLAAR